MFSTLLNVNFKFGVNIILFSANSLNLDRSYILSFDKEFNIVGLGENVTY